MKKIRFDYPYNPDSLLRQTPGGKGAWGDYQFYFKGEEHEYDYWVALNDVPEEVTVKCGKDNTILVTGEPESVHVYHDDFAKQFKHLITCQRPIKHPNPHYFEQGLPWFPNKDYDELSKIRDVKKEKLISVITSNKMDTEGHRKRYEFVMALKEHFGDKLDLFGRGIKDFDDKWDVIAPYKYSINIENSVYDDYFTEKLTDCYLSNTLPLYYGCPNLEKYFDKDAYVEIDLNDVQKSIKIIEEILANESFYEERLPAIKKAREQYLNEYSLFPLIVNYIESKKLTSEEKVDITLKPEGFYNLNPRVTVLIPLYNGEKYLRETLDSVVNQDYDRWELLVVNDGSTDTGPEIVKEYIAKDKKRIRMINNQGQKGIVGALNTGINEARGEFIARLDSDDICLPNRLSAQIKFMDSNQDVDVAGSWVELFGAINGVVKKMETSYQKIRATMLFHGVIYHPSVIFRTHAFRIHKIFYDYEFQFSEDYELWSRISEDIKIVNIPQVLLKYRVHNTNVGTVHNVTQLEGSKKTRLRALKKLGVIPNDEELTLHEQISTWNFSDEKSFISNTWTWFEKLMLHNNQSGFYEPKALSKVLVEKWLDVYSNSRYINKGFVVTMILRNIPANLNLKTKIRYTGRILSTFIRKIFK
jgi:glycosyltransferase involved in cell wall biosynthesis